MVRAELLRQRLAARQDHAPGVAPGVGNAQQLEITDDVMVEDDLAVKLLEQVEHHVRLERLDGITNRRQFVLHTERVHFVATAAEVADDVELRLPAVDVLVALALERIGRHELRMHESQDAKLSHTAIQSRRPCLDRNSIVRAVRSTMKSMRSCRSRPTTRSLSWRHRPIMSCNT